LEGIKHFIARDEIFIGHCGPAKAAILAATIFFGF
jgi:hypothetical protein